MKTILFYCTVVVSLTFFSCSDGRDGIDGIDGTQGEQGPQGPQGVEGNANVTMYIFEGYDFNAVFDAELYFPDVSEEEFYESGWFAYLVFEVDTGTEIVDLYYQIPGYGRQNHSFYQAVWYYYLGNSTLAIQRVNGPGEVYSGIRVIQVHANNFESYNSPFQEEVDFGDYEAVITHFGLKD